MKTKIVPQPFAKGFKDGENQIALYDMQITYCQECDDAQGGDEFDSQQLTIEAVPTPAEGNAGGYYYVISTNRWAVDSPQELVDILEDFIKRLKND